MKTRDCFMNKILISIAFLGLFVFGVIAILANYRLGGIYWDFIAYSLFAKSFLTPAFYSALQSHTLMQALNYQNTFYYESFRAPLMPFVLLPLIVIFGQNFAVAYILLLMFLLPLAVFYISKGLKMDLWISLILFVNTYALMFLTLLNGSEMLTMILLMFAVGLISKNKWQAGILMALAGLAKYPSLIFLPLLFMLKGRNRNLAILSFIVVTLPWLAFNFYAFSNPLFGYLTSLSVFSSGNSILFPIVVIVISLRLVLGVLVPAMLIFGIMIIYLLINDRNNGNRLVSYAKKLLLESDTKLVLALFVLGLLGFLAVSLHSNLDNLPRHGYLLYIGVSILLSFGITKQINFVEKRKQEAVRTIIYIAVLLIYASMLVNFYANISTHYIFNGYGSTNQTVLSAVMALNQRGLGNCNIVSNAWVYLRFYGVKAHSPYFYNNTIQHYPILLFSNIGVPSSIVNTDNVTKIYFYNNFTISLPQNYTC
ncbi:MAG: hypothetical protein QXF85_02100 [Candidatus Micrarchaeaceae archaeon]